ncbi:MAG: response regulator [Methylococcales bacterium]|jgi:CheY-like chemotaxis protein|nr:response regulator [Methylococcales bacterium]
MVQRLRIASSYVATRDRYQWHGIRVLVAEDSAVAQLLLRRLLSEKEIEFEIVDNGQDLVERALVGRFDLVLTDVNMPILGGLEATRILREKGFKPPIIAVTADTEAKEAALCLQAGCNGIIAKPIHRSHFFNMIEQSLEETNVTLSLAVVDEYSDDIQDLVLLFNEKLPQILQHIEQAIRAKAWRDAGFLVHNIKGTAGSFGHPVLSGIAAEVLQCIKAKRFDEVVTGFKVMQGYAEKALG